MSKLKYMVAGAIFVGLFIFFFKEVTELDVVAANQFSLQSPAEPVKAGDVVVQRESRQVSKICNAVLGPEARDDDPRTGKYYNRVDRIVASVVRMAARASFLDPDWAAEFANPQDWLFVGMRSGLKSVPYVYQDTERCPCEIARAMARGERVCIVNATLQETGRVWLDESGNLRIDPQSRPLAISLRPNVAFVPEGTFQACGVPFTEEAQKLQQAGCDSSRGLSTDVRIRKWFNLIVREQDSRLNGEAVVVVQ